MSAKKRGSVLSNHKKVGNRLKSPWLTEFNFTFVSYIDDTLPEIVLIGLLNDAHGFAEGARLSAAIGAALDSIDIQVAPLMSVLGRCSVTEVEQIAEQLGDDLQSIRIGAAPLVWMFPEHPLAALGSEPMSEEDCLLHIKECVDGLFDKNSTPACAAMANLYYTQARAGKLHIAQGLRVPNLEAILSDPESDDAHHASSSVRMHTQMLVMNLREHEPTGWPEIFWHRCYLQTECDHE